MGTIQDEKLRLDAMLFRGIDIANSIEEHKERTEPIFKDPQEYEHLSKEERENLTEDIKRKLSNLGDLSKFKMGITGNA